MVAAHMNVRTLCLSILYLQDASGYEIRKLCTEGEGAYFVEASFGSIYPALAKLDEDGLVTSRVEHQSGKPSKKIYSITASGRDAFVEALHEPIGDDIFRSPFLLFARFSHLLDEDLVRDRLTARLNQMDGEIEQLRRLQSDLDSGVDISGTVNQENDAWVIAYGLACLEVARTHLHTHMNALIASARRNSSAALAAE